MLKFIILSIIITSIKSDLYPNSYCDISTNSCQDETKVFGREKYLFYDVNPSEGFNLRRDVYMRFAIMLSESRKIGKKLNWKLVLPPWYNLYHWKTKTQPKVPIPWSHFFDINSLQTFAPVLELTDLFKDHKNPLIIDSLYVLQNYEDPFENGVFDDKWEVTEDCNYQSKFWGYNNISAKEVVCVKFQGKNSMLWELIAMHPADTKVMIAHGEIPLHDTYGTKSYWDCRKSMKFSRKLITAAKEFISKKLNCNTNICDSYLSIHWRRQDFAKYRSNDVPSIEGAVHQIHKTVKEKMEEIKNIFIATDAPNKEKFKLEEQLNDLGYKVYFYEPTELEMVELKDGGLAIVEQIICSHSAYFIGTHESTFSFRIQEEREILAFDSATTFNRLCPDKGPCERPSKWTIIN